MAHLYIFTVKAYPDKIPKTGLGESRVNFEWVRNGKWDVNETHVKRAFESRSSLKLWSHGENQPVGSVGEENFVVGTMAKLVSRREQGQISTAPHRWRGFPGSGRLVLPS